MNVKWEVLQHALIPEPVKFHLMTREDLVNLQKVKKAAKTELVQELIAWRLDSHSLFDKDHVDIEEIKRHLNIIKENCQPSALETWGLWGFRYSVFKEDMFPEELNLSKVLVRYRKWKRSIYKKIPKERLFSRRQRQKRPPVVQETAAHKVLPNITWIEERNEYATKNFPILATPEVAALSDLELSAQPLLQLAKKYKGEAIALYARRLSHEKSLKRLPYGLSGYEVRKFQLLCDQAEIQPFVIDEITWLKSRLIDYHFVLQASKTLFSRNKRVSNASPTDDKIAALVDYIPIRYKEQFQTINIASIEEINNSNEFETTSIEFILKVLRYELKQREISFSKNTVSLLLKTTNETKPNSSISFVDLSDGQEDDIPEQIVLPESKTSEVLVEDEIILQNTSKRHMLLRKDMKVVSVADDTSSESTEACIIEEESKHDESSSAEVLLSYQDDSQINDIDNDVPDTSKPNEKVHSSSNDYAHADSQLKETDPNVPDNSKPSEKVDDSSNKDIKADKIMDVKTENVQKVNAQDAIEVGKQPQKSLNPLSPTTKAQFYYCESKNALINLKMPHRFSHGWVLSLGNISMSKGHHSRTYIYPIGYSSAFKFSDHTQQKMIMYRFDIEEGPTFKISFHDDQANSIAYIYCNRIVDVRSKLLQYIPEALRSQLDILLLIGFRCKKIRHAIEGLPYALKLKSYRFLRSRAKYSTFFSSSKKGISLSSADFDRIPNLKQVKQSSSQIRKRKRDNKSIHRPNYQTTQGKKEYKTFFKVNSFEKFGVVLRATFKRILSTFQDKLSDVSLNLIVNGILTKEEPAKKELDRLKDLARQFECLFKPFENEFPNTEIEVQQAYNTDSCYDFSINLIENYRNKRNKQVKYTLPQYEPYFEKSFILNQDTVGGEKQDFQLISNRYAHDIYSLYKHQLSTLPCDIFNTSECVCGHEYHSPRVTLSLDKKGEILSSLTFCFSNIGYQNKDRDICILEIEGVATDTGHEGKGLASLLLLVLRLLAQELQTQLNIEIAMVAKTSTESEQWWSSRKGFYRSLREIKKLAKLEQNHYSRWKKWVEESGKKNHQFFNHQENRGKSAFWVSICDEITISDEATYSSELGAFLKKLHSNPI